MQRWHLLLAGSLSALVVLGMGGWVARTVLAPPSAPPAAPHNEPARPVLPPELVALGPGRILIGASTQADRPDGPAHESAVGRFALGRYEVSMGEYRKYAEEKRLPPPLPWDGIDDFDAIRKLPVNLVTRDEAARYCAWRYPGLGGRLPTEEEWEFAARDGDAGRRWPWAAPGEEQPLDPGRINAGRRPPLMVGIDEAPAGPSPRGILHLLGNVAEWTQSEGHPYPGSTFRPPPGSVVARGGGANTPLREISITARGFVSREQRFPFVGFRCAVDLP